MHIYIYTHKNIKSVTWCSIIATISSRGIRSVAGGHCRNRFVWHIYTVYPSCIYYRWQSVESDVCLLRGNRGCRDAV